MRRLTVRPTEVTVVRLGALCELIRESGPHRDFRISEFAVLSDGREPILHSERGLSTHRHGAQSADPWLGETSESLSMSVRSAVLPDDAEETGQDHPWEWLCELLTRFDVHSTVEQLKAVPYEVRFGAEIQEKLNDS